MSASAAAAAAGGGGASAAAAAAAPGASTQQQQQQRHQHQHLNEDAFKRIYPAEHFARYAAAGARPDGRALATPRAVSVGLRAVTSADGSALVKVGRTKVLAGVRLEVAIPPDDAPDRGSLVVSAELAAVASGDWRPGRGPAPEASVLAARVSDLMAQALDLRQLVISPGAAIWVLYLDLYVLDAAGGLLDAALLAALAALRDCRVPRVRLTDEGNVERGGGGDAGDDDEDGGGGSSGKRSGAAAAAPWRRLELRAAPVCLTCGVYKGRVVVDPDHEEEPLMGARASVVADALAAGDGDGSGDGDGGGGGGGELLGVYKPGGAEAMPARALLTCAALAQARAREVVAQLEAALEAQRRQEEEEQGAGGG